MRQTAVSSLYVLEYKKITACDCNLDVFENNVEIVRRHGGLERRHEFLQRQPVGILLKTRN